MIVEENIKSYWINWKGWSEDSREPIEVSVENGLKIISKWMQGDKIFILKGGAYSFTSVESIEPKRTSYQGKLPEGHTITESTANQSIKDLLEGKALQLKELKP